jgi:hypothetical protein
VTNVTIRVWEKKFDRVAGRSVYYIKCARTGCPSEEHIMGEWGEKTATQILPKKFKQKGWQVGRSCATDYCKTCVEFFKKTAKQRAGKATAAEVEELKKIDQAESLVCEAVADTANGEVTMKPRTDLVLVTSPEDKREMTRTDRRLIIAKIEEVYIDEDRGYDAGWDDQKVATELGVPRKWVETLRDENFGPAKSEDVTKMLADFGLLQKDVAEAVKRVLESQKDLERAIQMNKDSTARLAALEPRISRMERLVGDIEKRSR